MAGYRRVGMRTMSWPLSNETGLRVLWPNCVLSSRETVIQGAVGQVVIINNRAGEEGMSRVGRQFRGNALQVPTWDKTCGSSSLVRWRLHRYAIAGLMTTIVRPVYRNACDDNSGRSALLYYANANARAGGARRHE